MKRLAVTFVACFLISSSSAFAGWDTYVSSTGSDVNTCSRSAPCATLAGAFGATFANGVIHVIDSGAYGILTITHGITIDGGNVAATLSSGGNQIFFAPQFTVSAGASDIVIIMNFTMSGSNRYSFGGSQSAIAVTSVGGLHVQHCTFVGYVSAAIDFRATGADLELTDVTISDIPSGTGVYVANARGSLDNVRIHHTQTAVLAAGSSTVSIRRSTVNGNGSGFVAAFGPTAEIHVDDCMMTNNQWAIVVSGGAQAYLSRSSLFNNFITAMFNDGASSLVSYGSNQFASNASDGAFTSTVPVK